MRCAAPDRGPGPCCNGHSINRQAASVSLSVSKCRPSALELAAEHVGVRERAVVDQAEILAGRKRMGVGRRHGRFRGHARVSHAVRAAKGRRSRSARSISVGCPLVFVNLPGIRRPTESKCGAGSRCVVSQAWNFAVSRSSRIEQRVIPTRGEPCPSNSSSVV